MNHSNQIDRFVRWRRLRLFCQMLLSVLLNPFHPSLLWHPESQSYLFYRLHRWRRFHQYRRSHPENRLRRFYRSYQLRQSRQLRRFHR